MVDDDFSNRSTNRPFHDIAAARLSRRAMLGGSLATAAVSFFGAGVAGAHGSAAAAAPGRGRAGSGGGALDFSAVPLSHLDEIVVPAGYTATAFLPWGTPIMAGAGAGAFPADAAEQERRIGLGHDGMWFFPTDRGRTRGILCLNQEFGTHDHLQRGLDARGVTMEQDSLEFVRLSQATHGVSVVEIQNVGGTWQVVMGPKNRRITANSPVAFSGPAADSPKLQNAAGNPFQGTLNNCGNGRTPWGTYLTCEENFNGYFGATDPAWTPTVEQERYGLTADGFGYGWHPHDPRFDLSDDDHANEANRFGWIVEIDPDDPSAAPVKRTALGRVKHENCEIVEGRGKRIVAYMGDDERFEYVYKFVSDANWKSLRARGLSPLDHGTLYVARYNADGTGDWLPLTMDDPTLAAEFSGMDDLLVNTRRAADLLGATPMDRPEWAAVNPTTGAVFMTMTNNTRRTEPNPPNPRDPNPWGHILEMVDADEHVGTTFRWDIFVLSGPAGQAGSTTDPNSEHGSPDGLSFDQSGIMYIQTDGTQPTKDGAPANDQMLLADPATGVIKRFLTGVPGCEVTGWTPLDDSTFLANLQHPGDGDPAVSTWPHEDGEDVPRDACVVVQRIS